MEEKGYTDEKFERLLNELQETQKQLAMVSAAKFDKATRGKLDEKVDKKTDEVTAQAKIYGQNPAEATPSIEAYAASLESVRGEFATGKNAILMQNANLNRVEVENLADARITQLEIKKGDMDAETLTKKKEMLKGCKVIAVAAGEGSEAAHQNVEVITGECKEYIDQITDDKSLVVQGKQNRLAKFWNGITSRFNGKKKYDANVIKPLESKTLDIKENKVAEAREKVEEGLVDKIKNVFNKMKEKITELGQKVEEKLASLHISKKMIQTLVLAAAGVGVILKMYSPIDFGIKFAAVLGDLLGDKKRNDAMLENGEPAMA